MKDILVIENDLFFCLGIAFVDDAFYLAVDLARPFLTVEVLVCARSRPIKTSLLSPP